MSLAKYMVVSVVLGVDVVVNLHLHEKEKMMMSHEKLDVYQTAIEFFAAAVKLSAHVPRGNAELIDQMKRASMSIPLNIAEAVGKNSKPDMKRFLAIARGSALECAAIIDVGVKLESFDELAARNAKSLLHRIVAMLTKMIISTTATTTTASTATTTPTSTNQRPGSRARPG